MHTSPIEPLGSADAGGMNVLELNLAKALPQFGYAVDLVTRRSDPSQADVLEIDQDVRLLYLDAGPATPLGKSQIDQHIPQFAEGLGQLGAYDLFHCQHWMSGIAALEVAQSRQVPHLVGFHSIAATPGQELSQGEPPESPARNLGEAKLAGESDHIITVSAAEARTVIYRLGADPSRVTIIPPGVDLELFHPGPINDSSPGNARPYVVFVARLQPLKGADLVVEALALIESQLRPRFLIVGGESLDFANYAARLRQRIQELGLVNDVCFFGPASHEQLADLLRSAALVVIPSHSETFSLVALEAAACGTPVVASQAGGLPEAIIDHQTGYLVRSRQPKDWANAITDLLSDPTRLSQMAVMARLHARRFTWQAMAGRVSDLYETLLS